MKKSFKYWDLVIIAMYCLGVILLFSMGSCDVMKQSAKSKGEASGSEQSESWRKRKGDTVSLKPLYNYKFKDTTIYTVNREGTTLRTVYDERGQISNIDCFASAIEEMTKQNRQFFEQWKEKEKTKTEEANFDWVIYVVIGLVVLGITALMLLFIFMKQQSTVLRTQTSLLQQIQSKL